MSAAVEAAAEACWFFGLGTGCEASQQAVANCDVLIFTAGRDGEQSGKACQECGLALLQVPGWEWIVVCPTSEALAVSSKTVKLP